MKRMAYFALLAAFILTVSSLLQLNKPQTTEAQPRKVVPAKSAKNIAKPKPTKSKFDLGNGNAMTDKEIYDYLRHAPNGSYLLPYARNVGASCRKWGVNPALAIAMFQMESNLGKRMVKNTDNIGNLRKNSLGFTPCGTPPVRYVRVRRGPHAVFRSKADAINAYCWTIRTAYLNRGRTTLSAIISVYAPKSDGNDPDGYAKAVAKIMHAAL